MPKIEALQLVKEFLFPGRHRGTAIPPLDGGLTPNDELDALPVLHGVAEPDDVLRTESGELYATSGRRVLSGFDRPGGTPVATMDGEAGALAVDRAGRILVCVPGVGLVAVDPDGTVRTVVDTASDGVPLHCLTDLTVADDGTIYLVDGSTRNNGDDWVRDLMQQGASGRLLRYEPTSAKATVLASGLRYPSGITLTADGGSLVVCEAWAHRISRYPLDRGGDPEVLRANLPGYPGRISVAPDGGYWLAMFALRTQLVEFVLTQRDYVEEMMRTIEPDFWIRPALRGLNSGLEPLQGGQIRKLGVIKPWAPPRSYGLAARLDADGYARSSLHSRGGGTRHGVTSVRQFGDQLLIAVRGGDRLLSMEVGASA